LLKIGITGNIGSGKSTVCKIFETLNVPVYNADDRGKYLLQHNEKVKAQLIQNFGEGILSNSMLNRSALAKIVFNDRDKLSVLESIVHPAVKEDFKEWVTKQESPYIIKEAALLLEAGTHKDLDKLITVTAPLETRIKRVMERDHCTREEVLSRMKNQWPEEKKIEMADHVLVNDDLQLLLPQVLKLYNIFLGADPV
jgi:dephospho-CoA kinase